MFLFELFEDAFYSKTLLKKNYRVVQIYHCNFQTYYLGGVDTRSKISINGAYMPHLLSI
jgi:hypothetical protein